jgi:signal transduction histidine kinase/CheY-like chemotaxis protein
LVSSSGKILALNKSFERDFCPVNESAVGKSLLEFSITESEKIRKFLLNCSRSQQMTIGKMDFPSPHNQKKSYRCEGALLEPANGNNPAIIFLRLKPKELTDVRFRLLTEKVEKLNREILERKRAVERNKQLYIQAKEASRLKDEFLATISHELRTPLNAILGWIRIVRTNKFDHNLFEKAFETIERNARVQIQLIEDILDVSRIITGKVKLKVHPVDLVSIIESTVDSVRPMADNKKINLQMLFDSNSGVVSGDGERIQQIIWNLLTNALKFTPKGGSVEIKLQTSDSQVEIIVSDTGEGISVEFLPFVFERFLQADASKSRRHGGLGLGLALVRHLTELHGGTVEVQSEGIGKGTVFTVKLPIFIPEVKQLNENPESIYNPNYFDSVPGFSHSLLENLHFLIVEDEADSRDLLKIILENYNAKVETAASAAEAFEKFSENNFDLLISDIAMPDEDGYSLIKRIRAFSDGSHKRIPAIAMTAYACKEDRLQALLSGFDSYISKPYDPDELITIITEILDQNIINSQNPEK